jgi:hypothetical protein
MLSTRLDTVCTKALLHADLVTRLDGVDLSVGARSSTSVATEVILKNLSVLGGHVASGVLTNVLPVSADRGTIDQKLGKGVVSLDQRSEASKGGKGNSGEMHILCMCRDCFFKVCIKLVAWQSRLQTRGKK